MVKLPIITLLNAAIIILLFAISNSVYNEISGQEEEDNENEKSKIQNWDFSMDVNDDWIFQEYGAGAEIFPVEDYDNAKNKIHDYAAIFVEQDPSFTLGNAPLSMYVKDEKNKILAEVINETNIQLDGEDAVKVYYNGTGSVEGSKIIVIYAMHEKKPYFIQFMGFGDKFNNRLPEFEEMLATFKWEE